MTSQSHAVAWCTVISLLLDSTVTAQTNGLEGKARDEWYHLSQGTEFFPLRSFLALNDAESGKRFRDNLERFGFIPDPVSDANPYGLPVGMSVAETRDLRLGKVKMIGLNCSACHTAAFDVGGAKLVRIDGATSMFDPDRFRLALMKSTQNTINDRAEFVRFVGRLVRQTLDNPDDEDDESVHVSKTAPLAAPLLRKLSERLEAVFDAVDGPDKAIADTLHDAIRKELDKRPMDLSRGMITTATDPKLKASIKEVQESVQEPLKGFGALNPVKQIQAASIAEVIVRLRLLRARLEVLKSAGHPIMTEPGFGRVDAFGTARNKLFPDNKRALDAPVRFPFLWTVKDQLTYYHWDGNTNSRQERNTGEALGVGVILDPETFESTIRFKELMRLEELAMKITPPGWPKEFGPIDEAKAREGAKHFAKFCAHCHVGENADGTQIIKLEHIKTDPRRVQNIRQPVNDVPFFDTISPILKKTIAKAGGQPEGGKSRWRPSRDIDPTLREGYPNRPLPSIWASPPYLHNGSVPNLYQLLLPAGQRSKDFPLGHRDFDTKHLGYSLSPTRVVFRFDTRQAGNSNSGHSGEAYGTEPHQLTEDQRWELIEYLKTHK